MDGRIVQVALSGLENILRLGEQDAKMHGGTNPYAVMIEECYGSILYSIFMYLTYCFELVQTCLPHCPVSAIVVLQVGTIALKGLLLFHTDLFLDVLKFVTLDCRVTLQIVSCF